MDDNRKDLVGVTQTTTSQALILRLTGEIDLATSGTAYDRLRSAVAELPPPPLVVVDLTDVGFFSVAGVRLLRTFIDVSARHGLIVRVVVPPDSTTHRVLTIVGLNGQVPIFDTLDEALPPG